MWFDFQNRKEMKLRLTVTMKKESWRAKVRLTWRHEYSPEENSCEKQKQI